MMEVATTGGIDADGGANRADGVDGADEAGENDGFIFRHDTTQSAARYVLFSHKENFFKE